MNTTCAMEAWAQQEPSTLKPQIDFACFHDMIISPRKPESRLKSDLESQIIADTFKSIIFNNINFYIFVTNFLWQIEPSLWTFFVVFTIVSANLRRKIMELCNKLTMEPDKIHCTYTQCQVQRKV